MPDPRHKYKDKHYQGKDEERINIRPDLPVVKFSKEEHYADACKYRENVVPQIMKPTPVFPHGHKGG